MKSAWTTLSIRKSIVLYLVVFTLLALALSVATAAGCDRGIREIEESYPATGERYYLTNEKGERLGDGAIIGTVRTAMTKGDERAVAVLGLVRMLCVPVYSAACMIGAAFLFYRNKLKRPLELLTVASRKIAENDLDFSVAYEEKDEMGKLCASFEAMRRALSDNISQMARQMEERKRLNAAFAHDLRTPLTVLKGYNEMLQASGEEQTRSTALIMEKHIERLSRYIESMGRLRRLEDAKPHCRVVKVLEFIKGLDESAGMICKQNGVGMRLSNRLDLSEMSIDAEIVSQVCTNLIANAARYAESLVEITVEETENGILLSVKDDGKGFREDTLRRAMDPYFTEEENHLEHFGLGLYICKVLCEHHGGFLSISNTGKGAKADACFACTIAESGGLYYDNVGH